jgi:hypothetical protein
LPTFTASWAGCFGLEVVVLRLEPFGAGLEPLVLGLEDFVLLLEAVDPPHEHFDLLADLRELIRAGRVGGDGDGGEDRDDGDDEVLHESSPIRVRNTSTNAGRRRRGATRSVIPRAYYIFVAIRAWMSPFASFS